MTYGNIIYYQNEHIEIIYSENSLQTYPVHTHANHITIGYVLDGTVCIDYCGQNKSIPAGGAFYIMPDTPHSLEPIGDTAYSMISVCISAGKTLNEAGNEPDYSYNSYKLKQLIADAPENAFFIKDMARRIGVSPYHMIRQFKSVCGLTPHQFQIQCRVRKAQKLLEEGKSVTEAAYATGFCDQSHFDRCFRKIVRLTPKEYKQSVRSL